MATINPPNDLDAPSKALWKSAQKALEEQGTYRSHDDVTITMMVHCHALVRALEKKIGDNWTVGGSRGQEVANPLIKPLQEAMKQFLMLANALKFTPSSRAGIEPKPPSGGKFGDLAKS